MSKQCRDPFFIDWKTTNQIQEKPRQKQQKGKHQKTITYKHGVVTVKDGKKRHPNQDHPANNR